MNIFDVITDRRKLVVKERLKRLSIWGHPGLRVRLGAEGTRDYVFGCRAGPSVQFEHLAHELAHAVQFGAKSFEDRMLPTGRFRFGCRQLEVMGQFYDEPLTDQCTRREVETFAIQRHLLELAGYCIDVDRFTKDVSSTAEFLPDWHQHPRPTRLDSIGDMLQLHYERWTKDTVLEELLAWLDLQAVRMRKPEVAEHIGDADIFFYGEAEGGRPMVKASQPRPELAAVA